MEPTDLEPRSPRQSLVRRSEAVRRVAIPCGTALLVAFAGGCHPDHASFCATFSSGTGTTHVTVTDGEIECRDHRHAVAIEGEGDGRVDGREAGLFEGFAAGRSEGFATGTLDARDGMVLNPASPLCCLAPVPGTPAPSETPVDGRPDRSPVYRDAYRRGFRAAWDEAFEEAFADGYACGYDEGFRHGAR